MVEPRSARFLDISAAKKTVTGNEVVNGKDDIDRRDFLTCMAWAGTGLLWTFIGGVPTSRLFAGTHSPAHAGSFSFFQISDSHIGFSKPANMDVTATLKAAVDKINVWQSKQQADLILHTGDVSHISMPAQFDTAEQVIKGAKVDRVFYVPGEHDTSIDGGALYRGYFAQGEAGGGRCALRP